MRRCDLEHIIRAAGTIAGDTEIFVIGSQSILAQFPDAPAELLRSAEADVFPANRKDATDLIEGAIGEGSSFHELFGYYAQGVAETSATLPEGWRERLIPILNENTNGVTGYCLEIHDLAFSKYVAWRPKDIEFTRLLAKFGMTSKTRLLELANCHSQLPGRTKLLEPRIIRDFT